VAVAAAHLGTGRDLHLRSSRRCAMTITAGGGREWAYRGPTMEVWKMSLAAP
jgi:hypothetical protein